MQLTLRHLRYFRALVEAEHFGRAAAAVGVSQPALSARIAELETITGLQLAERHARGARITDAGHELAERAIAILAASSEVEGMAGAYAGDLTGPVRLGIIPSIAPFVVRRIYDGLSKTNIRPIIRETITERLMNELEAGEIDLVLASPPLSRDGIVKWDLGQDRFFRASPHGSAQERDLPLVLLEEGHCLREQAIIACDLKAPPSEPGVTSLATLLEMVASGACTTLLPELLTRMRPKEATRINIEPFSEPQPSRRIVLAHRKTDPRSEQFERFSVTLADILAFDR
ncbi:LysR family transcriptional regulator [Ahrensia sp. R2A130]|uniref:LysR family transcriptional regulator n=1 Tax=Ahrensia sp. R2A130 TaxID=744979 RepID=UPI0001E0D84E|nr:LysR family transcriptional regulator [Ahrensia sp. R2A130]EFL89300.1 probable hydrogen peroxide-inducible genes activator [Ahrensia sp. R2A130]